MDWKLHKRRGGKEKRRRNFFRLGVFDIGFDEPDGNSKGNTGDGKKEEESIRHPLCHIVPDICRKRKEEVGDIEERRGKVVDRRVEPLFVVSWFIFMGGGGGGGQRRLKKKRTGRGSSATWRMYTAEKKRLDCERWMGGKKERKKDLAADAFGCRTRESEKRH